MAFILVASGGSYEDAWQSNVAVSRDKIAIEELKIKKENEREFIAACSEKLDAFIKEWEMKNPFDPNILEKTVAVPKWPSGIDQRMITKEMRIERDTVRNFNNQVCFRNSERITRHNKLRMVAELEFCEALELFDVVDRESFHESFISYRLHQHINVRYEIEEVEEI